MESADRSESGEVGGLEIPEREAEIREQAVIEFINEVRQTRHIANFARMALRFGCTMQQAYAVAQWFQEFMASYCVSKSRQRAGNYIQTYQEPDWSDIAAEAGTTADLETWREWINRLLERRVPGKIAQ
jgi:hypothetical protein